MSMKLPAHGRRREPWEENVSMSFHLLAKSSGFVLLMVRKGHAGSANMVKLQSAVRGLCSLLLAPNLLCSRLK